MPAIRDYKRAAKKYRDAQAALEVAREQLYAALIAARADGVTLDVLADELGVSRERVLQILKG